MVVNFNYKKDQCFVYYWIGQGGGDYISHGFLWTCIQTKLLLVVKLGINVINCDKRFKLKNFDIFAKLVWNNDLIMAKVKFT
jgi:hypothetical protein